MAGRDPHRLLRVAALPARITLPLARTWHAPGEYFQTVAGRVLEEHAEPSDREWLEDFVEQRRDDDGGRRVCSEINALACIGSERSIPSLAGVAEGVSYSYARRRALRALASFPSTTRTRNALREALWDCESEARELACRLADSSDLPRVREMAAHAFEELTVRGAASQRLAIP